MGDCGTYKISIIGHRGAMGLEPENSFSSFERAVTLGCSIIEMDARSTLDGKVIIMHDATVDRTADGKGAVSGMLLAMLKELRLRNGEEIPTLEGILERFGGRCILNIELKDEASVLYSYEIVQRKKLLDRTIFSSFHSPWLVKLKLENPHTRTAFISDDSDLDLVKIAVAAEAESIHPSARITGRKLAEKAHENGLKINVWTVNRPWQMRKMIRLGADGIITDRPDILAEQLEKMGCYAGKT